MGWALLVAVGEPRKQPEVVNCGFVLLVTSGLIRTNDRDPPRKSTRRG
jgi:hypothetical protein